MYVYTRMCERTRDALGEYVPRVQNLQNLRLETTEPTTEPHRTGIRGALGLRGE